MPLRSLLAVASGLAMWLAFPSHNLWPLAILGVALLALATRGTGPWRGLLLGVLSGLACFLPLLHWTSIYVGKLPWYALCGLESLYLGLLGLACALVQRAPSLAGRDRVRPVAVALLWVGQEWLRARTPFGGFPWARLAFSQADSPLSHLAAWAGAPLVTFGVALAGGILAAALAKLWTVRAPSAPRAPRVPRAPGRAVSGPRHAFAGRAKACLGPVSGGSLPVWRPLTAVPALALAALVVFAPGAIPTPTAGPKARVLGIQGNVPQAGLEFNAQRRAVLDNHAAVTHAAARSVRAGAQPQPDLVVWPENASDIDPLRNPDAARVITSAVRDIDAPLIVGTVLEQPAPFVSNVSLLYEPGKGITDRYTKRHPVPFAEYIPYRSFFRHFSDKVDLVPRDFVAGKGVGTFRVPSAHAGPIVAGPVICFEIAYGSLVRDTVRAGANLLVVQTNNATFGYTDESVQQLAISRLAAIEHGRSVVHVSTVGVSALITPDGVAHQRTSLFSAAALFGQLPLRTQLTVADRVGEWPEGLASIAGVLLVLAALRSRRTQGRRRRTGRLEPDPDA